MEKTSLASACLKLRAWVPDGRSGRAGVRIRQKVRVFQSVIKSLYTVSSWCSIDFWELGLPARHPPSCKDFLEASRLFRYIELLYPFPVNRRGCRPAMTRESAGNVNLKRRRIRMKRKEGGVRAFMIEASVRPGPGRIRVLVSGPGGGCGRPRGHQPAVPRRLRRTAPTRLCGAAPRVRSSASRRGAPGTRGGRAPSGGLCGAASAGRGVPVLSSQMREEVSEAQKILL